MDQDYDGIQIEPPMRGVTAPIPPLMTHIPWHPARGVCIPCTTTPWDATPVGAAGQTSACPRMEVIQHLQMKTMPLAGLDKEDGEREKLPTQLPSL